MSKAEKEPKVCTYWSSARGPTLLDSWQQYIYQTWEIVAKEGLFISSLWEEGN